MYKKIIEEARRSGKANEAAMWKSMFWLPPICFSSRMKIGRVTERFGTTL